MLMKKKKLTVYLKKQDVIKINLLVVGVSGTGKSSLTNYYIDHRYADKKAMTLKMEDKQFLTVIRKKSIIGKFHDCPGQEVLWNKVKEAGIVEACAIIGVCSVDKDESCNNLDSEYLATAIAKNVRCHIAIICNKMDLKDKPENLPSYKKTLQQIERINKTKKK